jgi:hypothetical protein
MPPCINIICNPQCNKITQCIIKVKIIIASSHFFKKFCVGQVPIVNTCHQNLAIILCLGKRRGGTKPITNIKDRACVDFGLLHFVNTWYYPMLGFIRLWMHPHSCCLSLRFVRIDKMVGYLQRVLLCSFLCNLIV